MLNRCRCCLFSWFRRSRRRWRRRGWRTRRRRAKQRGDERPRNRRLPLRHQEVGQILTVQDHATAVSFLLLSLCSRPRCVHARTHRTLVGFFGRFLCGRRVVYARRMTWTAKQVGIPTTCKVICPLLKALSNDSEGSVRQVCLPADQNVMRRAGGGFRMFPCSVNTHHSNLVSSCVSRI